MTQKKSPLASKKHIVCLLVYLLVKSALILLISIASLERFFSAIKIVKNRLRNRMWIFGWMIVWLRIYRKIYFVRLIIKRFYNVFKMWKLVENNYNVLFLYINKIFFYVSELIYIIIYIKLLILNKNFQSIHEWTHVSDSIRTSL